MKPYLKLLKEVLEKEVDELNNYIMIKFENFTNPYIYLEICRYFKSYLEEREIEFIAKLSKEKYEFWQDNQEYNSFLEKLDEMGFLEKEQHLTRWRNYAFNEKKDKAIIFLMGTELVEDRGGLEDFYTISPDTIETYIGNEYSSLFKKSDIDFTEEEFEGIDNIYRNIFNYAQKDLLKLSGFIEECDDVKNFNELVKYIFENLYDWWNIPNINSIFLAVKNQSVIIYKKIDLLEKAFKFSRRVGLDKFQTDKKIGKLSEDIDAYYTTYKDDLEVEFSQKFPGYRNLNDFKTDLLDYIKGIRIDQVKEKLFACDFKEVNNMLNIKIVNPKKTPSTTVPKTEGDPVKALFLPILIEMASLNDDEKNTLRKIIIKVSNIRLSNTKSKGNDELFDKWTNMCRFLGGIENLINLQNLANKEGDTIEIEILAEEDDSKDKLYYYPFSVSDIKKLIDEGILKSATESESKSKINLIYEFYFTEDCDDKPIEYEYEWQIFDTDYWISSFNFVSNKILELKETEAFIPVGFSEKINDILDTVNQEEFIQINKDIDISYNNILKDILNDISPKNDIFGKLIIIGKNFKNVIESIYDKGLFNAFIGEKATIPEFLTKYSQLCEAIIEQIKNGSINMENVNYLSKAFLILNNTDYYSKSIVGAMVPPYHPVMMEKIVDRYMFLSGGFAELFNDVLNIDDIKEIRIKSKYERYDQLATITSALAVLVGRENKFTGCKNTYGFYSLYGQSKEEYMTTSIKYDFDSSNDPDALKGLLAKTPISNYISKVIMDYLNTYPSKVDGLSLAFIQPKDYKNIVSGLHDVVTKIKKHNKFEIKLKLYIYTSDFKSHGKSYIKYWINNYFTEEDIVSVETYLKYIDFSVNNNFKELISKNMFKSDITFMEDILEPSDIFAEPMNNFDVRRLENRYPAVYLPIPSREERNRKVVISQKQFICEFNHSQFIVYLENKNTKDDSYRIIKKVNLTKRSEELLEVLHEKSIWVVTLDESVDPKIIDLAGNKVISFSTGGGYFGELNTTISSNECFLMDLEKFLKSRMRHKFYNWNKEELNRAAHLCVEYAKTLDGAEILKSINPDDEAINNYLAYILTARFEKVDKFEKDKYYVRKMISLDSHSHLFDNQFELESLKNQGTRPDFLVLEIPIEGNNLEDTNDILIKAKIIECKLAKYSDIHLEKAKSQVIEGYEKLSAVWSKNNNSVEKRFWFNQLYRLLAFNNESQIDDQERYIEFINKLTLINEGQFEIQFENYIYTYWLDKQYDKLFDEQTYLLDDFEIKNLYFGIDSIKTILIEENWEFNKQEQHDDSIKLEKTNIDSVVEKEEGEIKDPTYNVAENTKEDSNYNDIDIVDIPQNQTNIENDIQKAYNNDKIISEEIINVFNEIVNKDLDNEKVLIDQKLNKLKSELEMRKIKLHIEDYILGPDIVRVKLKLGVGVDVSQVEKYSRDMMIWLSVNEPPYLFIEDGHVKLDMMREKRQIVGLRELLKKINKDKIKYKDLKDKFYAVLGADVLGEPYLIDFSDSNTPHLLIAGQTGSGKSVLLMSILSSIMAMYTPKEVDMLLVDPKYVELTHFQDSPYTKELATEVEEALDLLEGLVLEMKNRYKMFKEKKVQNIAQFNKEVESENRLKRIVMVFDEYASMMEDSKDNQKRLESAIKSLSQLARAAGIHLIICTQTPRADIITTTIRNNLTARVALKVADSNTSNLILDTKGAERLLGKGDMLFKTGLTSSLLRLKSPFTVKEEVEEIIEIME
ncbi:DNA translocase FtsK [Herbivorax sp. ANBcel31]|uniref:DNA translocase FtsK n=1 Tax=Herbivorax sp. ANBcel31 TaxID=3069754 RepID=UPI0027B0EE83|nr:DNA translocase FtsK [Herbivorax sp. ANBcel31]MDQ2087090.1 DNA translocase FtsK [Herbivorax sp. ANBcel31]